MCLDVGPVDASERVFEVMYQYLNAEVSGWAYPESREAVKIPPSVRIWKHQINCQKECDRINKKNYPK